MNFSRSVQCAFHQAQALAITMQLLELERRQPENTPEEAAVLENAMKNLNFRYLDTTETQTDQMLDSLGVARLTTSEIAQAIEAVVFDME